MGFKEILLKMDMFSNTLTFTFKGNKKHRTSIGAITTMVMFAIAGVYSYTLLLQFHLKTKNQTNSGITLLKTGVDTNKDITLSEENLYIAVSWMDNSGRDMLAYNYGLVRIVEYLYTKNGTEDNVSVRLTEDSPQKWTNETFPQNNKDQIDSQASLYCFPEKYLNLVKNSTMTKHFGFAAFKCFNNWPADLNYTIESSVMQIYTVNNYYDVNDPSSPVKSRDLLGQDMYLSNIQAPTLQILLRENRYTVNDGWFQLFDSASKKFYSLMEKNLNFQPSSSSSNHTESAIAYVTVYFEIEEINTYETTVISLFDIFGFVGGIFQLMQIFLGFIIGLFSSRIFKNDVLKKQSTDNDDFFTYPPYKSDSKTKSMYHNDLERMEAEMLKISNEARMKAQNRAKAYLNPNQTIELSPIQPKQKLIDTNFKDKMWSFKQFEDSIDCLNISLSINELKLYVSHLMLKDRENIAKPPVNI